MGKTKAELIKDICDLAENVAGKGLKIEALETEMNYLKRDITMKTVALNKRPVSEMKYEVSQDAIIKSIARVLNRGEGRDRLRLIEGILIAVGEVNDV